MTPERWQRVREIFRAALDREPPTRAAFVAEACAGDETLRQEVASLLAAHKEDGFLERPAAASEEDTSGVGDERSPATAPPPRVGSYRVEREIGKGGMGVVYLAFRDDDQYRKKVALKLLKAGMDSESVVRRFRNERQILANLDHPGVARMLDGGTTEDGRPYFVMEHVGGSPIDRFCDSRRLSIPERVGLFQNVCAAVHFAHQNLVVHRDIKPANILVTPEGQPKLLDFGIAKILANPLGEAVDLTATWERVLTPEYASPEQVRGETITTASDVYSLGVLLYELLTGRPPYRLKSASFPEIIRTICEVDPQRPSSAITRVDKRGGQTAAFDPETAGRLRDEPPDRLRRQLSGDLDAIVLKAMRKEPQRRYASAEQLSEDLRRHFEGLPVSARRGTVRYRAGKFVRRHRAGVAAAALLVLALVGGAAATAWQARVAARQRDLAVNAAHTMVHELAAGLERMVGPTEARLGLLSQAARVFDEATSSGRGGELGRQRVESSVILGRAYRSLGDVPSALRRVEEGVRLARTLVAAPGAGSRDRGLLAHALQELGDSRAADHRPDEADAAYREGLALLEELAASGALAPEDRYHLTTLLTRVGDLAYGRGRWSEAREQYGKAEAMARALLGDHPDDLTYRLNHAVAVERVADMQYYQDEDTPSACDGYRQALALRRRTAETAPNDPAVLRGLAIAMQNVGWCAEERKAWAEAQPLYEGSVAIQRRLLGADPHNTVLAAHLMGGLGQMGILVRRRGDTAGAVPWYEEAVREGQRFREEGRSTPGIDAKTAEVAQLQAEALALVGRTAEARPALELAAGILRELRAKDPANADYQRLAKEVSELKKRIAGAAPAAPRPPEAR